MEVKLYELGTLWKNPSKLHMTSALSNNFLDRLWAHPPLHPLSSLSNADTPRRTISNHFAQNSTLFGVGGGDLEVKWNTKEKPFQLFVTYDSSPIASNTLISFGFIPLFPYSLQQGKEGLIFIHFA